MSVVIRGIILPGGMDDLAEDIDATFTNWLFAPFTTMSIKRQPRKGDLNEPVHIIGHSLGANAALRMANSLGDAGVPVGVVIMLDPTVSQRIRHGSAKTAFQSSDLRARIIDGAINISRNDLDHMELTTDPKIRRFILDSLGRSVGRKKLSSLGKAFITSLEAVVTSRYWDAPGKVWTVGIGHTKAAGPPDPEYITKPMTQEGLLRIFDRDVEVYEARVNDAIDVPLKQHQFDALVSFDFNTGGIYRSRTRKLINEKKYEEGGKAMMGWTKPSILEARRKREVNLFLNGDYGNLRAKVYPAKDGKVQWTQGTTFDAATAFT